MGDLHYEMEFRCSKCDNLSQISTFCQYSSRAVKDMVREGLSNGCSCNECDQKMTLSLLKIKSSDFIENNLTRKHKSYVPRNNTKNMHELTLVCNYCGTMWSVKCELNRENGYGLDDKGLKRMGIKCVNPSCCENSSENKKVDRQFFLKALKRA